MPFGFRITLPQVGELLSLSGLIIIGDCLVQRLEHSFDKKYVPDFRHDVLRTAGMGLTGLIWVGPLTMAWFPFLHRYMATNMPHLVEGSFRYVFTKMLLENACLAGPCCLGFFIVPAKIEGSERWDTLYSRLKTDFVPTFLTDVAFWTLISPFNYKFVPVRYQPAISCMLGGVEAGGLSYLTHLDDLDWRKFFTSNSSKTPNPSSEAAS